MPSLRGTDFARLLKRPGYPSFMLTVGLSRISSSMFITAGVLFVLGRTGSPAITGVTAAASTLPAALTGPLLGAWLDVARSRRPLIVADQLLSVVALVAILLLAGHAPNWTVPVAAVLYSVTRPLSQGSYLSALAEISGPELLPLAGRFESVSANMSFVIGPAFAGILAGATSPTVALVTQAGATLLCAGLIAVNPVFDVRPEERASSARHAFADGLQAMVRVPMLRAIITSSALAAFGWGLMNVGFPLYAVRILHAAAHTSGYMWGAVAAGSIAGTFLLPGALTGPRMALSYGSLGLSALLWPLVHAAALGVLLIGLTGLLEGPAYSGAITLRQIHAPARVRAQVMTTFATANLAASSAGAAIAGLLARPLPAIVGFTVVNLLAAALLWRPARVSA